MNMSPRHLEPVERPHGRTVESAFTLIELFVVMAIIIVLLGLAFPAFNSVQNSARKTQAKNDLVQIVTAVNAYYTEYGKYPLASTITGETAATFKTTNSDVINTLRAVAVTGQANAGDALNPRKIVFLTPAEVKDSTKPRSGITSTGLFYDPWGMKTGQAEAGLYHIAIDADYSNDITQNPYGNSGGAGTQPLRLGVIAWSLGNDGTLGKNGNNIFSGSDDVISWQ